MGMMGNNRDRDSGRRREDNDTRDLRFEVEESYFVETGTFNDQYLRSYNAHLTEDDKDIYIDAVSESSRVDETILTGIASRIISPSSAAGPAVNIVNGWGERRFMFHIKVRIGNHLSAKRYQYISGYTDHCDSSYRDTLDPKMRMYINSVVNADIGTKNYGDGRTAKIGRVLDASHVITAPDVISDDRYRDRDRESYSNVQLMAPKHLMGAMMVETSDFDTRDHRIGFADGKVEKVRRNRGIATTYLSDAINGICRAKAKLDEDDGSSGSYGGFDEYSSFVTEGQATFSQASYQCKEPTISNDPFMSWLEDSTDFGLDRYITYGELCRKLPEFDELTDVYTIGNVRKERSDNYDVRISERGECNGWNGSNAETVVATAFCYSIPAIMMELMLTRAVFTITNEQLDGRIRLDLKNHSTFAEGVSMAPYLARFEDRVINEVFDDLTRDGEIALWIDMDCDIEYGTFISVSYDGGHTEEFSLPTFADGLYSPIVTNKRENLIKVAKSVSFMADHVGLGSDDRRNRPSRSRGKNNGNSSRSGRVL